MGVRLLLMESDGGPAADAKGARGRGRRAAAAAPAACALRQAASHAGPARSVLTWHPAPGTPRRGQAARLVAERVWPRGRRGLAQRHKRRGRGQAPEPRGAVWRGAQPSGLDGAPAEPRLVARRERAHPVGRHPGRRGGAGPGAGAQRQGPQVRGRRGGSPSAAGRVRGAARLSQRARPRLGPAIRAPPGPQTLRLSTLPSTLRREPSSSNYQPPPEGAVPPGAADSEHVPLVIDLGSHWLDSMQVPRAAGAGVPRSAWRRAARVSGQNSSRPCYLCARARGALQPAPNTPALCVPPLSR
jgi:hypothetical protein